jgi:hypothetical protein
MEKVDKYGNGGSPSQLIITNKYGKVKSIYQEKLILTTTGSSGPATLIGTTLNIPQYSGGGSTTWGSITGTLSLQTDLQTALNSKFDDPTGSSADYLDGTGAPVPFPTFASADKMVTVGRNSTGSTLYKGTIVYISGSTGNRPNYVKAQANSEATSAGTFGVILSDIPNNTDGNAVTIGTVDNLDTRHTAPHPFTVDTLIDGDTIYLSPTTPGYVTRVKPSAPNHLVYIGKVVRTSPTNGTIVYRIQNGYELDEIHDVAISAAANNDILQYELSTDLWKNKSLSAAGIQPTITPGALTKVDDTNVTLTLGGTPSTALLQGVSLTLGWTGRLDDARIASAATWNAKQDTITLTTIGTSGPATLVGSTLNIPQYGGGGGASIIKLTLQTLVSASWVLVGSYYTYTFSNVNITTNTRVDFTPENSSYSEVSVCGLLPQVDVAAGSCTFYSLFPPSTDIRGEITIIPTI